MTSDEVKNLLLAFPRVRIGDVAEVFDGPHATPIKIADGPVFLGISALNRGRLDLSNTEHLSEDEFVKWTRRVTPRAGDVVFSYETRIGEAAIIPQGLRCCLGRRMGLVRTDPSKLDPHFFLYQYLSPAFQGFLASRTIHGSTVDRIALKEFPDFEIDLPPVVVQRQVAKVMLDIDAKIDFNRRINQTLEAMAQAIFKSWFIDFDPVKSKVVAIQEGRDSLRAAMSAISGKADGELDVLPPEQYDQLAATAALFPDEMEESEQGEIPKGWSVSKVETLLLRLPAKTRYTKAQISEYGQIPVFEQGASIHLGYHNGAASYQANPENPIFIFGDHTCVTRLSCQPFDISQNVIPLQGKSRATIWVYYAVKEKQKFQEYRRHWMELTSKDVVIATADICLEFTKKIANIHLQIEANERQMQSLRALRDTLLPKLLSGELPVIAPIGSTGAE